MKESEFTAELGISKREDIESTAICVGLYTGGEKKRSLAQEHLNELQELAHTFAVEVKDSMLFSLRSIDPAYFLTKGKRFELQERVQEKNSSLVILDEEISPAQQRNLEKFLHVAVMDRTELILEIFAQRARSKEAQLQIELARVQYEFPRLKRLWSHFSRQRVSGGFLKGEGEKQLELDKRMLQQKIDRLKKQLKEVEQTRFLQSKQRRKSKIATFALVGYTNAGKSTLLNALTDAKVFVEDKLFATLDPTTRKFILPDHEEVLVTDTVGFIRKLPHHLVEAFRSTLESTLQDDYLLHIVDASHPSVGEHLDTVAALLKELEADQKPIITVFNKCDLVEDPKSLSYLRFKAPKAIFISAKERTGFDQLFDAMKEEMAKSCIKIKLQIPQSQYELVTKLYQISHVHYEEYEENDVIILVDLPKEYLENYQKFEIL